MYSQPEGFPKEKDQPDYSRKHACEMYVKPGFKRTDNLYFMQGDYEVFVFRLPV